MKEQQFFMEFSKYGVKYYFSPVKNERAGV